MSGITVYWNNITLLRRAEETYINEYLLNTNKIQMEYFGLGMPRKIRNQVVEDMAKYNEPNADVIVSTDFDIFQDKRILFDKLDLFYDLAKEFDIRKEIKDSGVMYPTGQIIVAHLLPLVICVNEEIIGDINHPDSLKDLCKDEYKGKIVLGSNDIAAGRTVVMNIWNLYGEDYAMKFLDNVMFVPIPSMAYNYCVIKKEIPICILPLILATKELKTIFPSDGCPPVPTYVCVKKNTPSVAIDFLKKTLFGFEMQQFYSERGLIIPSRNDVSINSALFENNSLCRIVFPNYDFRENFDMVKFSTIMDTLNVYT
ncbi:MAG: ABC transporter substrate-binding protein [Treponema sp.]|nr:ABC transporter substrate-binding protein [Treponema sp.]